MKQFTILFALISASVQASPFDVGQEVVEFRGTPSVQTVVSFDSQKKTLMLSDGKSYQFDLVEAIAKTSPNEFKVGEKVVDFMNGAGPYAEKLYPLIQEIKKISESGMIMLQNGMWYPANYVSKLKKCSASGICVGDDVKLTYLRNEKTRVEAISTLDNEDKYLVEDSSGWYAENFIQKF